MREYRFVSWNLGRRGVRKALAMLTRCDLRCVAQQDVSSSWLGGYGSVRLEASDPRLPELLAELRALGEDPHPRADRAYAPAELDHCDWLLLRVITAGLAAGANYNQPWSFAGACPTCGAGSAPIPPLIAKLGDMGKKQIDRAAHDGSVVVTSALARTIKAKRLTGVEFQGVRSLSQRATDPRFAWMRVIAQWPRTARASVIKRSGRCPDCGRSGHFEPWSEALELHYQSVPRATCDFNHTWEYFGEWKQSKHSVMTRSVGGHQAVIVSQKARRVLLEAGARRIRFEPIFIGPNASTQGSSARSGGLRPLGG